MVRKVSFAFEAVPTILLELLIVAKLIKLYQHEVVMKLSGGSGALSSLPFAAGSSERETMTSKVDKDAILTQKVNGELVILICMSLMRKCMMFLYCLFCRSSRPSHSLQEPCEQNSCRQW